MMQMRCAPTQKARMSAAARKVTKEMDSFARVIIPLLSLFDLSKMIKNEE